MFTRATVVVERLLNGVEQILITERFGQKFHSSGFHRLHGHWDVPVSGHENNRNTDFVVEHSLLQIEAAESLQPHIEHQATGDIRTFGAQKLLGGAEGFNAQANRPNKILNRLPERRVIVNDKYDSVRIVHATVSLPIGRVN